jgi:hypothetical protein
MRHFGGKTKKVAPVGNSNATMPSGNAPKKARTAAKHIARPMGGAKPRKSSGVPASKSAV